MPFKSDEQRKGFFGNRANSKSAVNPQRVGRIPILKRDVLPNSLRRVFIKRLRFFREKISKKELTEAKLEGKSKDIKSAERDIENINTAIRTLKEKKELKPRVKKTISEMGTTTLLGITDDRNRRLLLRAER